MSGYFKVKRLKIFLLLNETLFSWSLSMAWGRISSIDLLQRIYWSQSHVTVFHKNVAFAKGLAPQGQPQAEKLKGLINETWHQSLLGIFGRKYLLGWLNSCWDVSGQSIKTLLKGNKPFCWLILSSWAMNGTAELLYFFAVIYVGTAR